MPRPLCLPWIWLTIRSAPGRLTMRSNDRGWRRDLSCWSSLTSPASVTELPLVRPMKTTLFASGVASGLILLTALAQWAVHSEVATPVPLSPPSIDGTYELTKRVMANGTVLRPPSIVALYAMADGRFSLNLFVKNADGPSRLSRRSAATRSVRTSTANGSSTR